MTHRVTTEQELHQLAYTLLDDIIDAHVLLLSGPLGAGKTTFVQGLAEALGIVRPVRSPTYALVHTHPVTHPRIRTLVHIDLYRLDRVRSLHDPTLGLDAYLTDPTALVCVEWPERFDVPPRGMRLTFSFDGEDRLIEQTP